MSAIYEVLRQLDEWRHLPAYQLERRVDILFGLFLSKVIEKTYAGVSVNAVIPEFPLHKGELGLPGSRDNQSVKVDFAVFGAQEEKRRIFLVELKTDMGSLDIGQLSNMKTARCAGSNAILCGVKKAALKSDSKRKYAHLIWRLLELNCLQLHDCAELKKIRLDEDRPRLGATFEKLCVGNEWNSVCPDLVAVLPTELSKSDKRKIEEKKLAVTDFEIVTFDQFANFLEDGNQPFESSDVSVFADYLRHWAGVEAGRVSPWPQQS